MFGYVAIDKPNILIKDYQTYRAYYCGLCKAIGTRGRLLRLTLNYDIVLLALLGHNYEETAPEFAKGGCFMHPFSRKLVFVKKNDILCRVADINTILGYYKTVDDVIDENRRGIFKAFMTKYYRKAKKRLPDFDKSISEGYSDLRNSEKRNASLDVLSDCFGRTLMSAGDALTNKCDKVLREFLFYIGKWVYAIDAYDDIKKDKKSGNFNPFLKNDEEKEEEIFKRAETEARQALYDCVDRAIECYGKMKIAVSEGPLSNIVYMGLKNRTEYVLEKRGEKWPKIRL